MKKLLFFCAALIFILNSYFPTSAHAYSYGDPNEEKVAEVYKKMVLELDKNPPNFKTATKHFDTVKEEIDMHMGKEPAQIVEDNLKNKQKKQTIENMDKLLVLNIARRMANVDKNFTEYDTSKKLLAKGFATYEALSPKVEANNPETDKKLRADFDKALKALGNPGLFGVGKKESDKKAFDASKDEILTSLQKEFKLKSLDVGHFKESASEEESAQKKDWTDVSNLRNWIPLVVLVVIIAAVIGFTVKKRRNRA